MKRKKAVSPGTGPSGGSKKTRLALKVNKARHVFTRRKKAAASAAASADIESRAAESEKIPKPRAIKTLKRKGTTVGDRKKTKKQLAALKAVEPDLAQEKKVYRALKQLHIDFRETKEGPSPLARTFSSVTVTRNIKRRSESAGVVPFAGDTEEPSQDDPAPDLPPPLEPPSAGKKKNSNAGLQEDAPSEETTDTSVVQSETATKRTPKNSGSGRTGIASKSVAAKLKKSVVKSKTGPQTKVTPSAVDSGKSESMPDIKTGEASVSGRPTSGPDTLPFVPKTSKRFSTSVYSSRRKIAGASTPQLGSNSEPMEVDTGATKNSTALKEVEASPVMADLFQTEDSSENAHYLQEGTYSRTGRGSHRSRGGTRGYRGRVIVSRGRGRGFAASGLNSRGGAKLVCRGRVSRGRGRGFAASELNSRGGAKLVCRGRGRKKTRWTRKKVSTIKLCPTPEGDVEQLCEPDENDSLMSQDEPPAKRGRFKKTAAASADMNVEGDQEHVGSVAGDGNNQPERELTPTRKKNVPSPLAVGYLSRRKNSPADAADSEATASKPKTASTKTLKHKMAKMSSRSVESMARGRNSAVLGQLKGVAHSRSSSPGGTEVRLRKKGPPTAGELARSSSLDNLLYKSKSSPVPKHTRSKTFLNRSEQGSSSTEGKSSDNMADPESESAPAEAKPDTPRRSKGFRDSLKRKHSLSPPPDNQTGSLAAVRKTRLLTRLQDSSTRKIPNILPSCRSSRLGILGNSPADSRESSPGSVSKVKGKRELTDSCTLLDTPMDTAEEDSKVLSQTDDKNAVSASEEAKVPTYEKVVTLARTMKGRGKGRTKQVDSVIDDKKQEKDEPSQVKDELSKDSADKSLPVDAPSEECSSDSPHQSVTSEDNGTIRRRGRPKGATNKKFRLNLVKHHSVVALENFRKLKAFKAQLGAPLPGRPRVGSLQRDSVQSVGSELKDTQPDGHEIVSDDTFETKPLLKKAARGRPSLKSSQVKQNVESVSRVKKAKDVKPRTDLCTPAGVKSGDSTQNIDQDEKGRFSDEKSDVHVNTSETVKATDDSVTDDENAAVVSSSVPDQSFSETVPESMDVTEDSHLSSDLAEEGGEVSKNSEEKSDALSRTKVSDKSETLQTLVRMRRESRRQLKKSRWATGKLPKQSLSAQSSAVRWKKQSSESSDDLLHTVSKNRERSTVTEVPLSPSTGPSVIGDSETKTAIIDGLQDQPVTPSINPSASQEQPASDASNTSLAQNDSFELKSDLPSLAEPLPSERAEKCDVASEPADEAKSQLESEEHPAVGELSQEAAAADPASEDGSAAACEPLTASDSTAEDQTDVEPGPGKPCGDDSPQLEDAVLTDSQSISDQPEDKPGVDGEPSAHGQSLEPSLCAQPEEEPAGQTEELSLQDMAEELSLQDKAEELHQSQTKEPPVQDQTEEPSPQGQAVNPSFQNQSEEPVLNQSEELSIEDQSEKPSIQDPSKKPSSEDQSEEQSMEEQSKQGQPELSTQSQTGESVHDQVQPVTELSCPPGELPARDQTQTQPDASVESSTDPQHASDIVSGVDQTVEEQSQSGPDLSVECDDLQTSVSSNTKVDVPQASADDETCMETDAESHPQVVYKEPGCTEPSADQQSEEKPDTTLGVMGDTPSQGVSETSFATETCDSEVHHATESATPTKMETYDTEPHLPTTEATTAASTETSECKQDLLTESSTPIDVMARDSKLHVTPTDIDQSTKDLPTQSALSSESGEPDLAKPPESENAQHAPDLVPGIASAKCAEVDQQSSSTGQSQAEEHDLSTTEETSQPKVKTVPIAKRKQKAISRELKRLQTDEGAQKIMSWREKKQLKSFGKLLRSKIIETENVTKTKAAMRESRLKLTSSKMYSIDAISDTRLVFKTGKLGKSGTGPEHTQKTESMHDRSGSFDLENAPSLTQESGKKMKRGILSASSSMDSEDGLPPDITETPPYKDSRSERCRSEELSPPPLIRPEDLFSEEYYESMQVTPAVQCQDGKHTASEVVAAGPESAVTVPQRRYVAETMLTQASVTDIDTSQEIEASGAFSTLAMSGTKRFGPRKRKGRGKRKHGKIGPASKTGRELHVRPGPASSKLARRTSSPKQDPPFVRNMPHLPSEPRTFALRPKTTRSPIEIIAMKQKLEEEAYELEEATRVARKLKRRQALYGRLAMASDSSNQNLTGSCKPCSVVLVDFVKELHLNSIDTEDQYISDVSYDSDEEDVDDDDDDYGDDIYSCLPESQSMKLGAQGSLVRTYRKIQDGKELDDARGITAACSPPEMKKTMPDLDSLRGKGFMGNFVDFIQNRSSQPDLPSQKRHPQYHPRTPVSTEEHSVGSVPVISPLSVSCSSDSILTSPCLTTVSTSLSTVVSVPSHSQFVTSAQIHTPRQSQVGKVDHRTVCAEEDKTVSSSPSQAAESSNLVSVEKVQYSPHHHTVVKSAPEKSSSPGKLKVFPMRKENESVAADKTAFTRYLCTKCDFSATNKGTIESHIYRHIPGVTFRCGYCESEFTGLISALTHVKNSHNSKEPKVWISKDINEASLYTEEEIQSCPESVVSSAHSYQQEAGQAESDVGASVCDQPLVQEGQPVIISLVVSGDRPVPRTERFSSSPLATQRRFACTHCSYCTNVMEDAHQHVRDLHSDSSLFTCYLCDKAFGWSHQDIVAHCRATHPDRPKSFKKLPDFYDQELIRMNSSSGERPKSSEDRGNIFDRMSNFFPNLGPGGELMEDGQLSPQARFLRARDYLYIQEGWSKKTSAEADSTTIEDIEIPFEDAADVDSTSEEPVSQHFLEADEGALGSSTGDQFEAAAPGTSTDSKSLPSSQKAPKDLSGMTEDSRHTSQQNTLAQDIHNSSGRDVSETTKNASLTSLSSAERAKLETSSTSSNRDPKIVGEGTSNTAATVSRMATSGSRTLTAGTGDGAHISAAHPSVLEGSSGDPTLSQATKDKPNCAAGEGKQPAANGADGECEEDAETDILVIDLGEEDMADDTSHCSSAHEETPESSFTQANTHTADAVPMGKESASHISQEQSVLDHGFKVPTVDPPSSVLGDTDDSAAKSYETADDSMGIKILSVVSLRDKGDHATDLSISPIKSGSESDPSTPPSSSGKKPFPNRKSPSTTPKPSMSPRRKSSSSSKHLPEVDADDIATRNERMVCTYKCHSCSIHSPALAAIVEHLKQHHHDVPLFSCPYCKAKKGSFFTEESVHTHVSEHHPSNYAKNEVSLSEIAKSFVQVLALPSGNRVKGSLIEEDIYMCLQCESHIPDLDYALRHLKYEHPGLVKYACPICGTYSNSSQAVVKKHMLDAHGQASDSVQLAMAMEGVYLTKVTCISASGQYVDHAPPTPPKPSATHVSPSSTGVTASALNPMQGVVGSPALVSSGPRGRYSIVPVPVTQIGPLALTTVPDQAPSSFLSGPSGYSKSGKHKKRSYSPSSLQSSGPQQPRPILPMPGSLASLSLAAKKKGDGPPFHVTGMTVKDILDTRQKTKETPSLPITLDSSTLAALSLSVAEQLPADTLTPPRGMFSVADPLGRGHPSASSGVGFLSTHTATSSAPSSRPVLRVPNVSSVLDLTSPSRCSSVDTGTSVNTLIAGASLNSSALANASKQLPSLPFSMPATALPSSLGSLSVPPSPKEREDPEAFKIFNLKPRTPVPQSPRPGVNPAISVHKPSPPVLSPHKSQASNVVSGTVTMASSALFPQQFRLQQFPPVQPASIATLPLAQGGLPLAQNFALPIGAGLPLSQGLTIPLSVNQTPLLMAPNTFPPVLVPANLLPQLSMRGPVPQLPIVTAAAAPPPAHQPVSDVQTAPVNLSIAQPGRHTASAPPPQIPKPKSSKIPSSSFSSFKLAGPNRGRGRPRLQQKAVNQPPKPTIPGISAPRLPVPSSITQPLGHGSLVSVPGRQSEPPALSPKPQRHSTSHQCVCPYCPEKTILKPWEVAQHIKVLHPGKEVKYNRV